MALPHNTFLVVAAILIQEIGLTARVDCHEPIQAS